MSLPEQEQHSLLVEALALIMDPGLPPRWRLAILLHDAPEYVIGDIISPFKAVIGDAYKSVEHRILAAIHLRFSLPAKPEGVEVGADGRVYACTCSRSTFAEWAERRGRAWSGPGCPGRCREAALPEDGSGGKVGLRVAVGAGSEGWLDLLVGPVAAEPSAQGDPLVRDRLGNWTYAFCVVADDLEQGVDLVIRGRDLLDATAPQLRLAALLGRERPPAFLHHPLVRRQGGEKLSKAAADTSLRSLVAAVQAKGRRVTVVSTIFCKSSMEMAISSDKFLNFSKLDGATLRYHESTTVRNCDRGGLSQDGDGSRRPSMENN